MKKILLSLFIVCSLQTISAQSVTYGVKGGVNFASFIINFETSLDYKYKLGYQIGCFAKIRLTDKLYLQPELMYILQGAKSDIDFLGSILPQTLPGVDPLFADNSTSGKENESNIIVPIMLKYYFSDNFNIEIGPQVDYLFHIKNTYAELSENEESIGLDRTRSVSDFNFGINLGVAYDFNDKTGVGLRYNYGLNRFNSDYGDNIKIRNSVFQLGFEYRFN